jgi:hypothetical protein
LERIENKLSSDDFTQRCVLNVWQVEMSLEEVNRADDKKKSIDKLKNLLKSKEKYLDKVRIQIKERALFTNYYNNPEDLTNFYSSQKQK